jgi:hypothetical protein
MGADGIPYSIAEVREVLRTHAMDPHHRELLQWLLEGRQSDRRIAKEALDLAEEANGDPASCPYNVPIGERLKELRKELKSNG